jgi:hypothetical protein
MVGVPGHRGRHIVPLDHQWSDLGNVLRPDRDVRVNDAHVPSLLVVAQQPLLGREHAHDAGQPGVLGPGDDLGQALERTDQHPDEGEHHNQDADEEYDLE